MLTPNSFHAELYRLISYSGQVIFDIGEYFEPYVRQWLVNTDNKTAQWVQAVSDRST